MIHPKAPLEDSQDKMQCFGHMSFSNAGGVTQIKCNKDFYRGIGDDSVGAFHQLTTEMKEALLWVAMADASC